MGSVLFCVFAELCRLCRLRGFRGPDVDHGSVDREQCALLRVVEQRVVADGRRGGRRRFLVRVDVGGVGQKVADGEIERLRQGLDDGDRRLVQSPFDLAEVGIGDLGEIGQLPQAQLGQMPLRAQIRPERIPRCSPAGFSSTPRLYAAQLVFRRRRTAADAAAAGTAWPLSQRRRNRTSFDSASRLNSRDAAMNSRPRNVLPVPSVAVVCLTGAEVRFTAAPRRVVVKKRGDHAEMVCIRAGWIGPGAAEGSRPDRSARLGRGHWCKSGRARPPTRSPVGSPASGSNWPRSQSDGPRSPPTPRTGASRTGPGRRTPSITAWARPIWPGRGRRSIWSTTPTSTGARPSGPSWPPSSSRRLWRRPTPRSSTPTSSSAPTRRAAAAW